MTRDEILSGIIWKPRIYRTRDRVYRWAFQRASYSTPEVFKTWQQAVDEAFLGGWNLKMAIEREAARPC